MKKFFRRLRGADVGLHSYDYCNGIGLEIINETVKVLDQVAQICGFSYQGESYSVGAVSTSKMEKHCRQPCWISVQNVTLFYWVRWGCPTYVVPVV